MSASSSPTSKSLYPYEPSHVLPGIFGAFTGISLFLHVYQNYHYRYWRVTFFASYAGTVFTAGWFLRLASSFNHVAAPLGNTSTSLYIAQLVMIVAAPPIYAAVEYNILSRLLIYLPYHAPLHPRRVYVLFVYLGALVESLTAAGGATIARQPDELNVYIRGKTLMSIALVLQGVIECLFISVVAVTHRRHARATNGRVPKNVSRLCTTLYCTSTLVLIRCIFRAIESFSSVPTSDPNYKCTGICALTTHNEWYLYAFEAAPMVVYSFWLNVVHPGRLLPRERMRYLDVDGTTERIGPGWIDKRSRWETIADPFDIGGLLKGAPSHEKFWERPEQWPIVEDGSSFAMGTASNVKGRGSTTRTEKQNEGEGLPLREDRSTYEP